MSATGSRSSEGPATRLADSAGATGRHPAPKRTLGLVAAAPAAVVQRQAESAPAALFVNHVEIKVIEPDRPQRPARQVATAGGPKAPWSGPDRRYLGRI